LHSDFLAASASGTDTMTKCVIHIGMHKTGTSSIQKSLAGFRDQAFCYAGLGRSSNHSVAMFSLFSDTPGRHHSNSALAADPAGMKAFVRAVEQDLATAIRTAGARTLIISGEDIGKLGAPELKRMRDRLRQDSEDIRIIGYVRPPRSFITSVFQQMVRSGGRPRFELQQVRPRYQRRFEKFDTLFGSDRVSLKLFDRQRLTGGDVVEDFCNTLGIALPRERIVTSNESWPRQSVCLMFQYNRHCDDKGIRPMKGAEAKRLLALLPPLGQDKFTLAPALLEELIADQQDDIAWMEARLGVPLSEVTVARADDIASEDDMLVPVPGAHEALLDAARGLGIRTAGRGQSDAELLHKLRQALADPTALQRLRLAVRRIFGGPAAGAVS
jgi:hypothetical protein